jgi:DNA helicase MCM9
MYVSFYICMCLFTYVCVFLHMYVSFYICMCLFTYVCVFLHMYVSFYICTYVSVLHMNVHVLHMYAFSENW